MVTSPHFNNYGNTSEQQLLEDLLNEIVYLSGAEAYYLKRESHDGIDLIFGENPTAHFSKAWKISIFITNFDDWSGGGDIFSKFGMKINKQTNVVVTRRSFLKQVNNTVVKPLEGDLIWIPVFRKLFEIKFAEPEKNFYTFGKQNPYYYELQLEMYAYSSESINTGILEIDDVEKEDTYLLAFDLSDGDGIYFYNEMIYQESDNTITANVHSHDIANSKLYVYNIKGVFTENNTIIGIDSGASWNIGVYNPLEDNEDNRYYQNAEFAAQSNNSIVTSETSPFFVPWKV